MLIVSDVCDVVYNDVCNGLHEVVCDAPGFQNSWQMEFLTILSLLELDYVEAQSGITIFSIYYARPSWDILKYFSTVGLEVICGFLNYLQCIAMVKFVLCILGKVTHCHFLQTFIKYCLHLSTWHLTEAGQGEEVKLDWEMESCHPEVLTYCLGLDQEVNMVASEQVEDVGDYERGRKVGGGRLSRRQKL